MPAQTYQEIIADGLSKHFKRQPRKIVHWLLTGNPNFGGISPAELIAFRGIDGFRKVAKFVENAIDENHLEGEEE